MITVLIPAAGTGQRFIDAGYAMPKALIDVCGMPMLKRVIDNVTPMIPARLILVSRMSDEDVKPLLGLRDIHVHLTEPTEGAIDTILKARDYITDGALLIANCDQIARFDPDEFIASAEDADGAIVTFRSSKPHHSYVATNDEGAVTEIAEKIVISNQAVTGIYFFRNGRDFVRHAQEVIANNDRYNSEFYVSSAISRMINNGRRFVTCDAPTGILGTPEELQLFEMAVEVGRTL